MKRRITIDPITRLEGHGRIEIFLDAEGDVENAYFIVPELRGFEQFCVGRSAEEMPNITNRICGICPEAHHIAAGKALDDLYGVEPPLAARLLRELFYCAFFVADHTTHFYVLGGPDLLVGPEAPAEERNIFGVVAKLGAEVGTRIFDCRRRNHGIIGLLGGRSIHPNAALPGGWSRAINEAERGEIVAAARQNVDFALFSLDLFEKRILTDEAFLELLFADSYRHETYYSGTVDPENRVNFYDGTIRVVAPDGHEFCRYAPRDYAEHIAERVESWTYLKFPYLRNIGWQGLTDGPGSGVYCSTPLARLNVADGMATPLAQKQFEKFYGYFGNGSVNGRYRPVHQRLATHWARLIEMLYAAERMAELAAHPALTSPEVRVIPTGIPREGVGCIEAPRGTLTHHYWTDERGVLTRLNLIVGTTNNHAPIAMSVKRAAQGLIKKGRVIDDGLLNRIEMAFRLYDPCFSCATHALPGSPSLVMTIRDHAGEVVLRKVKP
ncbi:MAG: Ni/Fe hydrogenase subunit alpha [Proteobacteria bacterium]|nr:Ni/Fe hydrogenase subunit alpha [Pseudomonadota bacterium]MBU1688745.1 Ni/Fe hydrogenase subunit alpha [Pseudomonadota bacterium]